MISSDPGLRAGAALQRFAPGLPIFHCQPKHLLLAASLLFVGALPSAIAQPSFYWRGGDGKWSDLGRWAESADGAKAYNAASYGDVSFNTAKSEGDAQVITLDVERTIRGLDFTTSTATNIIGDVDRTLNLYTNITVHEGAGPVTIGTAEKSGKVSLRLNSEPNTWTNESKEILSILNTVQIGDWSVLSVAGAGNIVVYGAISQKAGTDALLKSGTGVLTLAGTNTYWGTTTVTGGALVVNGNQEAATGNLTVTGKTSLLAGDGTIGGNTTLSKGATHSPGAIGAVGRQTFDQAGSATTSLTYGSGSVFSWDLDTSLKQKSGIGYDAVDVTGKLAGGEAVFRIVLGASGFKDSFWESSHSWSDIFTHGGKEIAGWSKIFSNGLEYTDSAGTAISPVGAGSFSLTGNTLAWTPEFTPVPEPSSALAGLLIAAGLLRRRRR